jgi:small subunit ribosomal protein S6
MVRYETLVLTVPEITTRESTDLESQFEQVIKKNEGSIKSFERWGKYKLAYPVWNNEYGVYFLSRFEASEKNLDTLAKELESLFKLKFPQLVMRFMTTKLDPHQSLAYQKPDSLEDTPSQDVDAFLRENKMEGLLKTSIAAGETSVERSVNKHEFNELENNEG